MQKIIQILREEGKVYGLGDDNKIYRWSYSEGKWEPHWEQAHA